MRFVIWVIAEAYGYVVQSELSRFKEKKIGCLLLQIKMEKENNLRMFCSTTGFENIRKRITETIAINYILKKDRKQKHFKESCNRNHQN